MPNRNQFKSNEEYNEWYKQYRLNNLSKIRGYRNKYQKKWRKNNKNNKGAKLKQAARLILNTALRNGIITRGKCLVCQGINAHAHHDDYTKPLEVKWLCPLHHNQFHKGIIEL